MVESRFLSLTRKARTHSYLGGSPDYWHGYRHGLRRGFLGELFGTDDEHKHWMRLTGDGSDKAGRERGLAVEFCANDSRLEAPCA